MTEDATPKAPPANASFELASKNTSLSFQRTRLSADRTLMSVIRTSLSLISFGFTIFKLAQSLVEEKILKVREGSAGNGRASCRSSFGFLLSGSAILLLPFKRDQNGMAGGCRLWVLQTLSP